MRRSRTRSARIREIRVALLLFVVHRAAASLNCRVLPQAHGSYNTSIPAFLYCFGPGARGNWSRIQNGTERLIADFNATNVDLRVRDGGYEVAVADGGKTGWIGASLNVTRDDRGSFSCSIGNETRLLRVPALLQERGIHRTHEHATTDAGGIEVSTVVLGLVMFACAIAGLLWLARLPRHGRSEIRPTRGRYRSFEDRTVRVYERDELRLALPISSATPLPRP